MIEISGSSNRTKWAKGRVISLIGFLFCLVGGIIFLLCYFLLMDMYGWAVVSIIHLSMFCIIIISALLVLRFPLVGGGVCVTIVILGFLPIHLIPFGFILGLLYVLYLYSPLPIMGGVLTILGGILVMIFHKDRVLSNFLYLIV